MKKNFKFYFFVWAILFVLFNVLCFVSPNLVNFENTQFNKFGGAFWAGYVFITLAFAGQIICAYFALKEENMQKLFYKLPLIIISYAGLILTVIFGGLCMAVPNMPNWLGAVVCILILAFNAIAVIKAVWAADAVSNIDEKIKAQTSFIKNLTVNTESILARAKSDAVKAECKKVYEAVRYSDPMSNEGLSVNEAKITVKLDEFASAVGADDAEKVKEIADEIVILVGDRNKKCKVLK